VKFIPGVTQLLGGSNCDLNDFQLNVWNLAFQHLERNKSRDRKAAISAVGAYIDQYGQSSEYSVCDEPEINAIRLSITWEDGARKGELIRYD
jgi:hypothetical protein